MANFMRRVAASISHSSCTIFGRRNGAAISLSYQAQRAFVDPAVMKLDVFQIRSDQVKAKFGSVSMTFKDTFLERLHSKASLFNDDCVAFIHLSDAEDGDHLLELSRRYSEQMSYEREFGVLADKPIGINVMLLKKFYLLNLPDKCLELCKDLLKKNIMWTELVIAMDMLYESGWYKDCVEIFLEFCEKNEIGPFRVYPLAQLAAFKLNTPESLKQSAAIFDYKKKAVRAYIEQSHLQDEAIYKLRLKQRDMVRLLAFQCLKQGFFNAAITLLRSADAMTPNFVDHNIRALAFLMGGRSRRALDVLRQLVNNQREIDDEKREENITKAPRRHITQDLYNELLKLAEGEVDENGKGLIDYVIRRSSKFVSSKDIEYFVTLRFPYSERKRAPDAVTNKTERVPRDEVNNTLEKMGDEQTGHELALDETTDELKTDELKTDELKTDELKTDELNTDELNTDELNTDELNTDEQKTDEQIESERNTNVH